jgi:hypothetical protein
LIVRRQQWIMKSVNGGSKKKKKEKKNLCKRRFRSIQTNVFRKWKYRGRYSSSSMGERFVVCWYTQKPNALRPSNVASYLACIRPQQMMFHGRSHPPAPAAKKGGRRGELDQAVYARSLHRPSVCVLIREEQDKKREREARCIFSSHSLPGLISGVPLLT